MLLLAALSCFVFTYILGWFFRSKAPSYGSLAILLPFSIGMFLVNSEFYTTFPILIGGAIMVAAGVLSEKKRLSNWWMLAGQMAAALTVIYWGRVEFSFMNTYFGDGVNFYALSVPLTLLLLISITNSLHLSGDSNGLGLNLSVVVLIVVTTLSFIIGDISSAGTGVILGACILALLFGGNGTGFTAGRAGTSLIGFIIAVITVTSFSSIEVVYIPFYLICIPILIYSFLIHKGTDAKQSANVSVIIAVLFSLPLFFLSPAIIWAAVILAAFGLILHQFVPLYR